MMTREEILKLRPEFAELIARRPPLPPKKPAPSAVVPLGEKLAEVAKAKSDRARGSGNRAKRGWHHLRRSTEATDGDYSAA